MSFGSISPGQHTLLLSYLAPQHSSVRDRMFAVVALKSSEVGTSKGISVIVSRSGHRSSWTLEKIHL
jgi:hypothetical protein